MGKILGYVALISIVYLTFKQINKMKGTEYKPKIKK